MYLRSMLAYLVLCFNLVSQAQVVKKIVFIGDSLTAGYGVEKDQAFPALIEKQLNEKALKVKIVNAGISGSTSASCVSRLKWQLKSKPDVLFMTVSKPLVGL